MNRQLQRINEARKYRKAILKRYGENVDILDNISSWQIDVSHIVDIFGNRKYKVLWSGENLRDAVYPRSEIRWTFLHETLHWIDDQAASHHRFGRLPSDHFEFEARLADLSKRLGCKSLP